jgi:hypothetical protein
MTAWTADDLRRIGEAEELEISPVRRTGELRRRTPIWVVRAEDDLYVRAAYGAGSGWYGVARASGHARIWAGGVERDVVDRGRRRRRPGRGRCRLPLKVRRPLCEHRRVDQRRRAPREHAAASARGVGLITARPGTPRLRPIKSLHRRPP